MRNAIKQDVTVQPGGVIEIRSSQLKPGTSAEVIIILEGPREPFNRSMRSLIGAGKGAFATPQQADEFIRAERSKWD